MDDALAEELLVMSAADTAAAHLANSEDVADRLAWRRVTAAHGDRLGQILDAHGWPGTALVGQEAALAAFKLAQHADRQLELQRRALALMEEAVAAGEAGVRELAMLRDRVLVNDGYPQVYGTQIAGMTSEGAPIPWPVDDPERMDARRAEVGLESFAAHTARYAPPR